MLDENFRSKIFAIFFFSPKVHIPKEKGNTENVRPISLLLHSIRIFNMTRTLKTSYFHHLLNENNFRGHVSKKLCSHLVILSLCVYRHVCAQHKRMTGRN